MQAASERVAGVANQLEQFGVLFGAVVGHQHRVQAGLLAHRHSQCEVERRASVRSAIDYCKHAVERPFTAVNNDCNVNRQRAGLVQNFADYAAQKV